MQTQANTKSYQYDAIQTVNYIKQNYGFRKFKYDEIMPFFLQREIAPVVLYNLKMTNLLLQEVRGIYMLSHDANGLSDSAIVEKVKSAVSKNNKLKSAIKRDKKQKQLNKKIAIQSGLEIAPQLTEKVAIDFLKSKGYRVLKPVAQYEEV